MLTIYLFIRSMTLTFRAEFYGTLIFIAGHYPNKYFKARYLFLLFFISQTSFSESSNNCVVKGASEAELSQIFGIAHFLKKSSY